MRHYARHIGDWIAATAHLTETEEAIYSRLLDQYYMREGPLPESVEQCCRIARASSKEAKRAVDTILREFFRLLDGGWHQKRADAEIAAYQLKSTQAAENATNGWSKRNADALQPHSRRNANQEPVTSNQEPSKPLGRKAPARIDAPTVEHESLAAELGVSCQAEWAKYVDWQAATGKRHRDMVAGFRNWLRNAKRVAPGREPTLAEKRAANMALLTGQVRHERTIVAERVGGATVLALPGDLRESGRDDVGGHSGDRGKERLG